MERTEMELRELQEHFEEIEEREDEEFDYEPVKAPTIEVLFLVFLRFCFGGFDNKRTFSGVQINDTVFAEFLSLIADSCTECFKFEAGPLQFPRRGFVAECGHGKARGHCCNGHDDNKFNEGEWIIPPHSW